MLAGLVEAISNASSSGTDDADAPLSFSVSDVKRFTNAFDRDERQRAELGEWSKEDEDALVGLLLKDDESGVGGIPFETFPGKTSRDITNQVVRLHQRGSLPMAVYQLKTDPRNIGQTIKLLEFAEANVSEKGLIDWKAYGKEESQSIGLDFQQAKECLKNCKEREIDLNWLKELLQNGAIADGKVPKKSHKTWDETEKKQLQLLQEEFPFAYIGVIDEVTSLLKRYFPGRNFTKKTVKDKMQKMKKNSSADTFRNHSWIAITANVISIKGERKYQFSFISNQSKSKLCFLRIKDEATQMIKNDRYLGEMLRSGTLRAGSPILSVDGVDVEGMKPTEVHKLMMTEEKLSQGFVRLRLSKEAEHLPTRKK